MKPFVLSLVLSVAAALASASSLSGGSIKACGDGAGWPPYTFIRGDTVVGYDVDVLNEILTPLGVSFTVEMPPWRRCLFSTDAGEYQIALSASYSQERDDTYILTDVYYTLQPSYLYDTERYPDGLDIEQPSDVLNYRACGLSGYNYDGFGVDSSAVDRQTRNFTQVVQKTLAGRCDLFLARFEILAGFALTGTDHLQNNLAAEPIPGIDGDPFYMMVSRNYDKAPELVSVLNEGIRRLKDEGALDVILQAYLPE